MSNFQHAKTVESVSLDMHSLNELDDASIDTQLPVAVEAAQLELLAQQYTLDELRKVPGVVVRSLLDQAHRIARHEEVLRPEEENRFIEQGIRLRTALPAIHAIQTAIDRLCIDFAEGIEPVGGELIKEHAIQGAERQQGDLASLVYPKENYAAVAQSEVARLRDIEQKVFQKKVEENIEELKKTLLTTLRDPSRQEEAYMLRTEWTRIQRFASEGDMFRALILSQQMLEQCEKGKRVERLKKERSIYERAQQVIHFANKIAVFDKQQDIFSGNTHAFVTDAYAVLAANVPDRVNLDQELIPMTKVDNPKYYLALKSDKEVEQLLQNIEKLYIRLQRAQELAEAMEYSVHTKAYDAGETNRQEKKEGEKDAETVKREIAVIRDSLFELREEYLDIQNVFPDRLRMMFRELDVMRDPTDDSLFDYDLFSFQGQAFTFMGKSREELQQLKEVAKQYQGYIENYLPQLVELIASKKVLFQLQSIEQMENRAMTILDDLPQKKAVHWETYPFVDVPHMEEEAFDDEQQIDDMLDDWLDRAVG